MRVVVNLILVLIMEYVWIKKMATNVNVVMVLKELTVKVN